MDLCITLSDEMDGSLLKLAGCNVASLRQVSSAFTLFKTYFELVGFIMILKSLKMSSYMHLFIYVGICTVHFEKSPTETCQRLNWKCYICRDSFSC